MELYKNYADKFDKAKIMGRRKCLERN